jgi:hypothetical protein
MKRTKIDNRFMAAMLILVMAIAGMGLVGCSTTRPQIGELELMSQPVEQVELTFNTPLTVTIPEYDPITVEDFIMVGLFYFNKEQHTSAAEAFRQASARIIDRNSELARQCLVASATCYLIIDDRENFQKTTGQLKASYNRYQLMDIGSIDKRVDTLLRLSEVIDN